ncbi:MAG TPA: hypothetical protein VMT16_09545 [Thermoanaerobaculia bacterium]|nr:hypothetical protein [Thermoanaerobaculia bacterium]
MVVIAAPDDHAACEAGRPWATALPLHYGWSCYSCPPALYMTRAEDSIRMLAGAVT